MKPKLINTEKGWGIKSRDFTYSALENKKSVYCT